MAEKTMLTESEAQSLRLLVETRGEPFVAGGVGVHKSTLSRLLARQPSWRVTVAAARALLERAASGEIENSSACKEGEVKK